MTSATTTTATISHQDIIASELHIATAQVAATAALLSEGATVPFIARYRKEVTGSLDEVVVMAIRDRLAQLAELDTRREAILKSLEQHGHLTDELRESVLAAQTITTLEDIYLPYRPKRRTKATIARERGLAPLAGILMAQTGADPLAEAVGYVNPEKEVPDVEAALEGARHIIAEDIAEDADTRADMRRLFLERGAFSCRVIPGKETEGAKYKDYFEWSEPVSSAPSHRILAMRRGEKEEILSLATAPPEQDAIALLERRHLRSKGPDGAQVALALADGYKRLLSRSMETEIRLATKERADAEAIRVFAANLRELLLAPPLGAKRVLGVDPGFRTGCKIVCLDAQGKLLAHDVIYLHQEDRAVRMIRELCASHRIEAVAIGNGTASRETEALLRGAGLPSEISIVMVNESGASVYSASETARTEFPDLDLTVRGSVSIGRRLMDPLAELVKIDPKSIGVGQYQHDVDQGALKQSLDDVVISCVNRVGVDVNRASAELLAYVSGLGPQLARNILAHRNEYGPFATRADLKAVRRLGPKAFEQCAGFLRIPDGPQPLDASAVHPESYAIVGKMAADLDCTVSDLIKQTDLRRRIQLDAYVSDTVGLPTLRDILAELDKPGRDPRERFEVFSFAPGIEKLEDLLPGMKLPGIVTNVTAFGAFVDVGVHQDGLVHVSELADRFVDDPARVVRVQQKVMATVLAVDPDRRRISLSLRTTPSQGRGDSGKRPTVSPEETNGKTGNRSPKKKGGGGKPEKGGERPFHNPFADALRKLR